MNPWHFLIRVIAFCLAGFLVQFFVWLHGLYIEWRYPQQTIVMSDVSRHSFIMSEKVYGELGIEYGPEQWHGTPQIPFDKWQVNSEIALRERAKHGTITGLTNV